MPITPFHFGPGLLLKSFAANRLSWISFATGNVLIDLEPIAWFLISGEPAHRHAHTWIGALLLGALTATAGRPPGEAWLRFWNRQLNQSQRRWLACGEVITPLAAWCGALTGTLSHIALDSIMHGDIRPWWPFSDGNALLRLIPLDTLHALCLATALWGLLRMGLIHLGRNASGGPTHLWRRGAMALADLAIVAALAVLAHTASLGFLPP